MAPLGISLGLRQAAFDDWSSFSAHAALTTFTDNDLRELQHATQEFLQEQDGECACFDDKFGGSMLPGENFLLLENDTGLGLSVEKPSAQSIFDLVDSVVDPHVLDEDIAGRGSISSLYTFFDSSDEDDVQYTALHVSLSQCDNDSEAIRDDISEASSDASHSSTPAYPPWQSYYDAGTYSYSAYTAFNQLLADLDDEDILPRINRERGEDEDDHDLTVGIMEIGELSTSNTSNMVPSHAAEINEEALGELNFDFQSPVKTNNNTNASASQPVNVLHSDSSYRPQRARRRPEITLALDMIQEVSEGSSNTTPGSICSDSSIGFAEHRGFVRILTSRRASFLSDEDTDDEGEVRQSEDCSLLSEASLTSSACSQTVFSVEHTDSLFDNDVWRYEPELTLTTRRSSTSTCCSTWSDLSDLTVLETVEIEVNELLAYMFDCIQNDRTNELMSLASDLHWALSLVSRTVAGFSLAARLGDVTEILLERLVALDTV